MKKIVYTAEMIRKLKEISKIVIVVPKKQEEKKMSKELTVVNPINELATYLKTDAKELAEVLKKTAFKNCQKDEEFKACVMVANTYKLNPILKQIYAFPAKGGGIVPVVSIDGWIKLATDRKSVV